MLLPRPRSAPSRTSTTFRILGLALVLAACGERNSETLDATPEEVDLSTPVVITEQEAAAFRAPTNGLLSDEQVDRYLRTSLLQFDLVRQHAQRLHERVATMQQREQSGGVVAGLRNLVDAGRTMYEVGDLFAGSYIRSARTLGYNPAELEWVRERIAEVGSHLMAEPVRQAAAQGAREMRATAEQLRQQLASGATTGYTEEDIQNMLRSADEMEANAQAEVPRETLANLEVLRRAKPAVTNEMWTTVSFSGGTGLIVFAGLGSQNDAEAQQKLDEYRRLFEDALANRVTPGMEDNPSTA